MPNLDQIEKAEGGIIKKFKLQSTINSSNLVLFNSQGQIHRYKHANDIVREWFGQRSILYEKRKDYQLQRLLKEFETLRNKARFIKAVIDGSVKI